jgi:glycosyltransferase involved in cell wall biosynthesis
MLKILYDHQCFSNQEFGGISRYFTELIYYYQKTKLADIEIALRYSNNYYLNKLQTDEIKNYLKGKKFYGKITLINILNNKISFQKLNAGNFDIFHPTYYNPYFLKALKDKPFVITVYDMIHELFPSSVHPLDRTIRHKKQVLEKARKVICISNNTKIDLLRFYNLDESKIEVIHLAHTTFDKTENQAEHMINLPSKYILYVGGRKYYKNFNRMIKALSDIFKQNREIKLICVGGGKFSDDEENLFIENDIKSQVEHYKVNDESLGILYANALCFIYPSLYEGFGIPILEAFSYGCPVVCSNASSFPEVAMNAAEYFDPLDVNSIKDSVQSILSDDSKRFALKVAGFERAKDFSWEKTAQKTFEVYQSSL